MKNIQQILVPIDFSPTAEKAFRFAVNVAVKNNAKITLYHNYIPMENEFIDTEEKRKQNNKRNVEILNKKLERLKKKVVKDITSITVSTFIDHSPIIKRLISFSESNKIDLIIMGTQGTSGLKKTIIGSIASKISEKSKIPVLLIPGKYELGSPKHMIFASNYLTSDKRALSLVIVFANLFKARVTVLHLHNAYANAEEKQNEKKLFDTYATYLQRKFKDLKLKFLLKETSSVTESMENLDNIISYDMMVMVRRKKSFFEKFFLKSFTNQMAYVTRKPLLIVPEAES